MDVAQGREYVLTLSCPDRPGIVYAVSSFLVQHSANILASQQYGQPKMIERPDGRFFMRVHFSASAQDAQLAQTFISRRSSVASHGWPRRFICPGSCTTRRRGSAA